MKKVLSLILVAVMLVSVLTIPTYAAFNDTSECKYFEKFLEYNYGRDCECYYELFYHYSEENSEEPDWTLIYSRCMPYYDTQKFGLVIGDRVLWNWGLDEPRFKFGFGVYVTELETFIAIKTNNTEQIFEYCPDFLNVLDDCGYGNQFGDVNDDDKLNIIDATYIQRMVAGYNDIITSSIYPISEIKLDETWSITQAEYIGNVGRLSDFNRDGERSVLDATAIQMKLAKVEDTVTE